MLKNIFKFIVIALAFYPQEAWMSGTPMIKLLSKNYALSIQESGHKIFGPGGTENNAQEYYKEIQNEIQNTLTRLVPYLDQWFEKIPQKEIDLTPIDLNMETYLLPRNFFEQQDARSEFKRPSILVLSECQKISNPKRIFGYNIQVALALKSLPEKIKLKNFHTELCQTVGKFDFNMKDKIEIKLIKGKQVKNSQSQFVNDGLYVRGDLYEKHQSESDQLFNKWQQTIERCLADDKNKNLIKTNTNLKEGSDLLRFSISSFLTNFDFKLFAKPNERFSTKANLELKNLLYETFKKESFPFEDQLQ